MSVDTANTAKTAKTAAADRMRARLFAHPEWIVAAGVLVLLVATSANYGFHRDEMYFVVAGRHPDYGYPDQPALAPLIAAAFYALGDGSIVVFRLAAAIASAATVLVTAGIAGLLGAGPRGRLLAALGWGVSGMALVTGHFFTTTTLDVLATAIVLYCLLRAIVRGRPRWVMLAGLALGVGLLDKLLVGIVTGVVVVALLVVGPRRVLLTRWSLWGILFAVAGAAPYLVWQALHGWPQLDLTESISQQGAQGGRPGVIVFQLVLVSPVLFPVLVAGIVWMLRRRQFRALPIAYIAQLLFLIASGGKAYYAGGLLPLLVAAGMVATDAWLTRARSRIRAVLISAALALALATNSLVGLALLPPGLLTPTGVQAVNRDAGEQVGWPRFAKTVSEVYESIPLSARTGAVIVTANYGEAGAIDLYGRPYDLPFAYSGHNAFSEWGPPNATGPVVLVGYDPNGLGSSLFTACSVVARVDNGYDLDNDEQGTAIQLCSSPRGPWSSVWPQLTHFD